MECGQNQTLLSALASLLRKDSEGNVYLNLKSVSKDCEDIPLVDCDLNHLPFETLLSLAIGDDDCDGVDHKHQMTTEFSIDGTDKKISSMLICNVRRTDGGADDTWSSALSGQLPLLLEVDFHYRLDSLGSKSHMTK